jgi:hypothetical protein
VVLEDAGLAPGDILKLSYSVTPPGLYLICNNSAFLRTAAQIGVIGVFSSSDTLLGHNAVDPVKPLRVPGAIDAGTDAFTGPTHFCNNEPNDIPQDFQIFPPGGSTMQIPAGATHLFLGINDSFYADNCYATPTGSLTVILERDIHVAYDGQSDCNSSDSGFDATDDPPWLSVAVGQSTQVAQALITPAASVGDVDFQSADPNIATVRPATAGSSPQTLQVTGVTAGTTTIDALADGNVLGSLNVAVYEKKALTVAVFVITPQKRHGQPKGKECKKPDPGTTQASLQTRLNNIWDQAAVQFTVKKFVKEKVDFDLNNDCRLTLSPSSSDIGQEGEAIIKAVKDPDANINVYYVQDILTPAGVSYEISENGVNSIAIFIRDRHPGINTENITAHEIGHGLDLDGTTDSTRLMHDGPTNLNNNCFLNKSEWDKSNATAENFD